MKPRSAIQNFRFAMALPVAAVGTADTSPENFLQGKSVSIFRHFGFHVPRRSILYLLNSESTTKTHGQSERGIKSMLYVKLPPTNKYTLTMGIQEILHFSLKIFFHFFFAHTHQDRKKKSFLCEISTAFLFRKKEYLKSAQK